MLALEPVIVARVRAAIEPLPAVWTCYGYSSDEGQRDNFPLASVMFADARVTDSKTGAAVVLTSWRVTLITRIGDSAAGDIDAAFQSVMAALHNWSPGEVSGRRWNPMRLEQAMPPQYPESGHVGIDLNFTTHAHFAGQD